MNKAINAIIYYTLRNDSVDINYLHTSESCFSAR